MTRFARNLKSAVTAVLLASPALAQDGARDPLDDLFAALETADGADADQILGKISAEWSKSGSPALDLLLQRGRDALEAGDSYIAIGHLTALVDHAPTFAEGYNARATVYFTVNMYGPALDDIRTTLALNPRHLGAMTGLAVILSELGEDVGALQSWREVLRLHPANTEAAAAVQRLERLVEGRTL